MNRLFYFTVLLLLPFLLWSQNNSEILTFNNLQYGHVIHISAADSSSFTKTRYRSQESANASAPFNTVVFNGTATQQYWNLEVRFLRQNETWSPWQETEIKCTKQGRFWAKAILLSGIAKRIRYRLMKDENAQELMVRFFTIEAFDSNQKTIKPSQEGRRIRKTGDFSARNIIPKPSIISREEWGAVPPSGSEIAHNPYRMTLHHTAMQRVQTLQEGFDEMQFIQDFHMNTRGWKDIAYHYCVDDSGRIYEGVPDSIVGTHVAGANTGNIGVAMLGYFGTESPPSLMIQALIDLYSYLASYYQINPDSLLGHREYNSTTSCPGNAGFVELEEIRNQIRKNLAGGAPYIANPFPQPFSQDVEPSTSISFHIKDEDEGVAINSIKIWINDSLINPDQIQGDAGDYYVLYHPTEAFDNFSTVHIQVQAADLAAEPDSMNYTFRFKTKAIDALVEVNNSVSLRNGNMELIGDWQTDNSDVSLPGLESGVVIRAEDSTLAHTATIYPDIVESGNYLIYMAFAVNSEGTNARYRIKNANGLWDEEFIEYNSLYQNKWGQLGNGPVYLNAGMPSNGLIELSPPAAMACTMMVDAFRFEKQPAYLPPAVPELKYVRFNEAGNIEVAWYPSLEGDIKGYRLYKSSDGRNWSAAIADEMQLSPTDTFFTASVSEEDSSCYFRLCIVDSLKDESENGTQDQILSGPSDTYGAAPGKQIKILIVDNFDRRASWAEPQHFFVRSYGEALAASNLGFESCSNDAVQSGIINLMDYDLVIYFCGDDGAKYESVSAVDMAKIREYLKSGGKLFISGSEIGYDLGRSGRPGKEAYNQYLKAEYKGDDSGIHSCSGAPGTVFEGLEFNYGEITEDTYVEDWPDYIAPVNGGETALYYLNSSKNAAVCYSGKFENGAPEGQLVHFAFTWETIYPRESRALVMARILNYFGLETGFDDGVHPTVAERFELFQNFPNPFNPITVISYQLPAVSRVEISIYNILGQEVTTLVNRKQSAGIYKEKWDATGYASGVYFFRLKTDKGFVQTKKMLLMK